MYGIIITFLRLTADGSNELFRTKVAVVVVVDSNTLEFHNSTVLFPGKKTTLGSL